MGFSYSLDALSPVRLKNDKSRDAGEFSNRVEVCLNLIRTPRRERP
jgi:hypothetical protein